jgi:hypothetical protein
MPFSSAFIAKEAVMHLWKEGDCSEAICRACEKRVGTRFAVRKYTLQESGAEVPDLLVAVCEECDAVVAIPAQSTPRLKEARERRKAESLEAKIPSHLDDVIHLLAERFATAVAAFRPDLLRFYLGEVVSDVAFAERVKTLAASDLAEGRARMRISLRAPEDMLEAARESARSVGITSDADLIRGILIAAKEDVLEGAAPERALRLGGAAQAEGAMRPVAG